MKLYFQDIEEQLVSLYESFFYSCIVNAVLDVRSHVSSMSFQLFVILCVFNVPLLYGFCANTLIITNYYYYYYYYFQSAYENIVL